MNEFVQPEGAASPGLEPAQVEHLRGLLLQVREDTLTRLVDEEQTARATLRLAEPMDAAEAEREQEDAAMLVELTRARLRDIEDALLKIESGRYGLSDRSGRPIGFERLRAIPWARLAADEE